MPMFADLTKSHGAESREFCDDAPAWRVACDGLNMEGKCNTPDCDANGHDVIHQVGYGTFDMVNDVQQVCCPICKEEIKAETCGFSSCFYTFEGEKKNDEDSEVEVVKKQKEKYVGERYLTFNPDKTGKVIWLSLKIHTREIWLFPKTVWLMILILIFL